MFASLYSLDTFAHFVFLSVLLKQILVVFIFLRITFCYLQHVFLCISTDKLSDFLILLLR